MNALVHRPELLEDPLTLAIELRRRRGGEDRIALELDEGEIGLHALDDGVEEVREHGVGGRDARAEIDPVRLLDAGHEARVAGDVGEQQISLACRRIRPLPATQVALLAPRSPYPFEPCALGRIRTCAPRSGGACSIP